MQELYGVNVSHSLISTVTEAVEAERKTWQNRNLDAVYPVVYFDAWVVKVRQDGRVINKAIHLALGVNLVGAYLHPPRPIDRTVAGWPLSRDRRIPGEIQMVSNVIVFSLT
ncbi:MAG: transposase [Cyanobacteria bacterium REEB459]|nr:transposase [Cyanobacteria bacterium REEB459]